MPTRMIQRRRRLTPAELATLHTTPVVVIPAPPLGKWVWVHLVEIEWRQGKEPITSPGSGLITASYAGTVYSPCTCNWYGTKTNLAAEMTATNFNLATSSLATALYDHLGVTIKASAALDMPDCMVTAYVTYSLHDV